MEEAILYLQEKEPSEIDGINLNVYKSNLSNALIRQGKFEQVIKLLGEVISTDNNSSTISERLLRSEGYVQIDSIEDPINDLSFVIEHGGRYR